MEAAVAKNITWWKTASAALIACAMGFTMARAESPGGADLILAHGNVLTVDPRDSTGQAIAIREGRVLQVGPDAAILALASAHTRIVDLHGRTATPGLIDTHAHVADGGLDEVLSVQLADAISVAEIVQRVRDRAIHSKPGEWVRGVGWDEGKLAEHRYVLARDLDAAAPDNPVWLEHTTGHYGVANGAALRLAKVRAGTPDPAAGTIEHDRDGSPTGVLKEGAMAVVKNLIPDASQ